MPSLFARIKIASKIYCLIALMSIGLAVMFNIGLNQTETALFEGRTEQTRRLVESAASLIATYVDEAAQGTPVESAQAEALKRLKATRYDGKEYFWVHGLDGIMKMHPIKPAMDGTNVLGIKDASGRPLFATMNQIVSEKGQGSYSYDWPPDETAQRKISYIKAIPAWGWVVGTGVYVADIQQRIQQARNELMIAAGIVLFISLIIATLIGATISKPILSLNKSMKALADGDMGATIPQQARGDEIGQMARTVKVFQDHAKEIDRLKQEQTSIQERLTAEKKKTMEALATDFDSTVGQLVQAVAQASLDMQSNAKNLAEMAQQTNDQTSTVATVAQDASASVQTVAAAAEELSASIGEINRQVEESSRVTEAAVAEVRRTDETVSTLSEAAAQIGDVVKLISNIAGQTNLLALNATIEAARAGEAGKGFAVVASEVKGLANQTAKATEEITRKIETVQTVSNNSVEAIRNIGNVIAKIDEISKTIMNALSQQNVATREISDNVQRASAGLGEMTSSVINVSHAAKESLAAASDVRTSSTAMSQKADDMRVHIQDFLKKIRMS